MSRQKYALIANAGVLIGCFSALYLIPPATPLWLFLLAGAGVIVALNLAIFLVPRIRKGTGTPARTNAFRSITLWVILALILFAQILMRLGYYLPDKH
jgi:hypothetical protein